VVYFGNAVGDTGDGTGGAAVVVDQADVDGVKAHFRNFRNRAGVTDAYDLNRDSLVDAVDAVIARDVATGGAAGLHLAFSPTVADSGGVTATRVPGQVVPTPLVVGLGGGAGSGDAGVPQTAGVDSITGAVGQAVGDPPVVEATAPGDGPSVDIGDVGTRGEEGPTEVASGGASAAPGSDGDGGVDAGSGDGTLVGTSDAGGGVATVVQDEVGRGVAPNAPGVAPVGVWEEPAPVAIVRDVTEIQSAPRVEVVPDGVREEPPVTVNVAPGTGQGESPTEVETVDGTGQDVASSIAVGAAEAVQAPETLASTNTEDVVVVTAPAGVVAGDVTVASAPPATDSSDRAAVVGISWTRTPEPDVPAVTSTADGRIEAPAEDVTSTDVLSVPASIDNGSVLVLTPEGVLPTVASPADVGVSIDVGVTASVGTTAGGAVTAEVAEAAARWVAASIPAVRERRPVAERSFGAVPIRSGHGLGGSVVASHSFGRLPDGRSFAAAAAPLPQAIPGAKGDRGLWGKFFASGGAILDR
jgi:hypothetical protein